MMNRRCWIRLAIGGLAASRPRIEAARGQDAAGTDGAAARAAEAELKAVRAQLEQARIAPIHSARSVHYQALGDAPEPFLKLVLADCEQIALDFHRHFHGLGFPVRPPAQALTIVVFRDDRSFGRFFRVPSLLEAAEKGRAAQPAGVYDRKTNILYIFDWRNVPMYPRAAHRNMETLVHEGTHQLCFNTGLLDRAADTPLCIVEGLGAYGEPRRTMGRTDFGRPNLRRMEDLARIQRRVPWIPLRELIADDNVLRAGSAARVMLAYAQSWLLVHFLLKDSEALPRFRRYLREIAQHSRPDHRVEDAEASLGDLGALDRALRHYAVRLQMSL